MRERESAGANIATTVGAVGCSTTLFMLGLGLVAFISRDNHEDPRPESHPFGLFDGGGAPGTASHHAREMRVSNAPFDDEVKLSACRALEPALMNCFREAVGRDPSAGRQVTLLVQFGAGEQGARVVAGRVRYAPSPFFRPCFKREAGFNDIGSGRSVLVTAEFTGDHVRWDLTPSR